VKTSNKTGASIVVW